MLGSKLIHVSKRAPWPTYHLRLRPGHTALCGLIMATARQKVISREADDVVLVDVEFKTSNSWFIDMAGRGGKSERRRTRQKVLNCSKL